MTSPGYGNGQRRRGIPLYAEKGATITVSLQNTSHASSVAREDGDVSFSAVWRIAEPAGIELTAGHEANG
jgi:hypothetical protein